MATSTVLFLNQTTNANSTAYKAWGSTAAFHVFGTWDSATCAIHGSLDNSNWTALTNGSFTANGCVVVSTVKGMYLRAVLSSAGASTSLSANLLVGEC